jgi:hypothetical protein
MKCYLVLRVETAAHLFIDSYHCQEAQGRKLAKDAWASAAGRARDLNKAAGHLAWAVFSAEHRTQDIHMPPWG